MRFLITFLLFTLFPIGAQAVIPSGQAGLTQIAPVTLVGAGVRQRVSATNSVRCKCVVINALFANTGTIYIGDNAVANTNGYPLAKGDTLTMCAQNTESIDLLNIWFDGSFSGDNIKVSCSRLMSVLVTPKPI